jgi:hypothetical protein
LAYTGLGNAEKDIVEAFDFLTVLSPDVVLPAVLQIVDDKHEIDFYLPMELVRECNRRFPLGGGRSKVINFKQIIRVSWSCD